MSVLDARAATSGVTRHGSVRVQLVNCYVKAASDVLASETGGQIKRLGLQLEHEAYTSEDVTAMVGVSGAIGGSFYLSMNEATALRIVTGMLGQETTTFDELAQSGIAELSNVIAGTASIALAELGFTTNITPPLLLVGAGARLSSVEIQRMVVPLETPAGQIRMHVAVRESA